MDTHGDVLGKRILALVVDSILVGVVVTAVVWAVVGASPRLMPLGSLVGLILFYGYFIYFEGRSGQTIGKKLLDVVVVNQDGSPVGYGESAIRNVLRIVDALPTLYLLGLIVILVSEDNQRIGDLVADTVVVGVREEATPAAAAAEPSPNDRMTPDEL